MIANTQYLVSTAPIPSGCHRCRRVTLCGLDCGMSYKVDPAPLTLAGELDARLTGRRIYRLVAGRIAYRAHNHIREGDRYPVIASHTCAPPRPEHLNARHAPALLELIRAPAEAASMLAIDPATNTLRPVPIPSPPPF